MKTSSVGPLATVAVLCVLASAGCKKTATPQPEPAKPAPTVAATTSAPALAPTAATPSDSPAGTTEPATVNGVTVEATTGESTSVPWALKQDEIKNDPAGQWASAATASSTYNDAKDQQRFAPWQATGAPNVDKESDNPAAWTTKTADSGIEWIDLTFPKAVAATGLRIRENDGAGSIIKVELFDEKGSSHTLWSGTDPTRNLNYLMFSFPKTEYKTNRVKITLATNVIPGWNEIDAVQLLSKSE